MATPSMTTATDGSLFRACEMPRTVTNEVPWFCVCTRVMFGVRSMKSCGRSMPAAWMSAAVNTFTATGTLSEASSRLRAVTMTSSRLVALGVCACRVGAVEHSAVVHASMIRRLLMFMCGSPKSCQFVAHDARSLDHRAQLRVRDVAPQVLHAAVRRDDDVLCIDVRQRPANARCDLLRRLGSHVGEIEHAEQDFLARQLREHRAIEIGLRSLDRDLRAAAARQLRQERVTGRPLVNDCRVAKADVHSDCAAHTFERAVECFEAVGACLFGPRLHIGLVELHDVRAVGEQIANLLIHGSCIVERGELATAVVVFDLRLLRHRERTRHRDFRQALGVSLQEQQVVDLHCMLAADRTYYARHGIRMTTAIQCRAGIVDVDAFERCSEAIRIAFAADLTVGDDVEPGLLLRADRDDSCVVLRLREPLLRHAPQLASTHTRREAARELLAIDQPFGLRIAADESGWKQHAKRSKVSGGCRRRARPAAAPWSREI